MKTNAKNAIASALTGLLFGVAAMSGAQASPIGILNDGADHTASTSGYWSLFVNAGDVVTVTARRLQPTDIWAVAYDGADGTGNRIGSGDDQLPAYAGGSWGDPQFSFVASSSGEYSVGVFRCCSVGTVESLSYFVNAQGATGLSRNDVPVPGTLALVGAGLFALGLQRRKPVEAPLQAA